ncbi:PbsX family transcriptional regulator [Sphaerotilus mobilis]|uniref:Antitoxin MazE n=1 Tax=Sphaerotilus mobilis TaxID=47994 RepID=A0A4Q7LVZ1_9BURK|nr:PbsX family transcriptional regulator [Sphaerotilus mobilis]RZS58168.1 antitoxin MazE [Sphaerotilus mobilis]
MPATRRDKDALDRHVYIRINTRPRNIDMSHFKTSEQTVQAWGNGLGIRVTAAVAKAARLSRGSAVVVEVVEDGLLIRPVGLNRLTLAQKLAAYDPVLHGGEAMADGPVGVEAP